jgi:hypothetical protein
MNRPLVLLALLAPLAAPLAAQTQVDFTPRIGVYVPLEDLTAGTDPITGLPASEKAETKFTIGGRIGVWLAPAFGFETTVDYNKSGVNRFVEGVGDVGPINSHLFATSGRAMTKLSAPSGKLALILSAGAGLFDRGGDYTSGLSGRTDFAGAGGVGLQFRISRNVAGRLDADVYTYKAQYSSPTLGTTSDRRQWDLFITFGLTGPFRDYAIPGET